MLWGVEVSSGHGGREVKTSLQLSNRPLVDHVTFDTGERGFLFQIQYVSRMQKHSIFKKEDVFLLSTDLPNATLSEDGEDPAFFSTMVSCSLVNFA